MFIQSFIKRVQEQFQPQVESSVVDVPKFDASIFTWDAHYDVVYATRSTLQSACSSCPLFQSLHDDYHGFSTTHGEVELEWCITHTESIRGSIMWWELSLTQNSMQNNSGHPWTSLRMIVINDLQN